MSFPIVVVSSIYLCSFLCSFLYVVVSADVRLSLVFLYFRDDGIFPLNIVALMLKWQAVLSIILVSLAT